MIRTSLASFADSRLIYSVIGGLINGLLTNIKYQYLLAATMNLGILVTPAGFEPATSLRTTD